MATSECHIKTRLFGRKTAYHRIQNAWTAHSMDCICGVHFQRRGIGIAVGVVGKSSTEDEVRHRDRNLGNVVCGGCRSQDDANGRCRAGESQQ